MGVYLFEGLVVYENTTNTKALKSTYLALIPFEKNWTDRTPYDIVGSET